MSISHCPKCRIHSQSDRSTCSHSCVAAILTQEHQVCVTEKHSTAHRVSRCPCNPATPPPVTPHHRSLVLSDIAVPTGYEPTKRAAEAERCTASSPSYQSSNTTWSARYPPGQAGGTQSTTIAGRKFEQRPEPELEPAAPQSTRLGSVHDSDTCNTGCTSGHR